MSNLGIPTGSQRHAAWTDVPESTWSDWRWQLRNRVTRLEQLEALVELTEDERQGILRREQAFPFAITPYYLSLMSGPSCPVRRQAIPHVDETIRVPSDMDDPLAEEEHSSVPGLTHRYPDRALLYVTHNCPVYCRHCTRQRKVGDAKSALSREQIDAALHYVERTPSIKDVLVSGGDPLSLSDDRLVELVQRVRQIPHVEIIRLCTRNPVTLPQRITEALLERLRPHHPIFVNTHFNHPRECTPEAGACLRRLSDAGFSVGNQMVLLRGINDDTATVEELNRWLLRNRCRPYYIFQCDPVVGTSHLRTPVDAGVAVIDGLRGRVSGLAIPQFAVDLPGGGGKITLTPDRLVRKVGSRRTFRGTLAREFDYVEVFPSGGSEGGGRGASTPAGPPSTAAVGWVGKPSSGPNS